MPRRLPRRSLPWLGAILRLVVGGGGADPDAISKYPWEIARDVALFAASAYLVVGPRSALALDTWLFPRTPRELDREEDSDVEVRT
jgi:hypothetical protein